MVAALEVETLWISKRVRQKLLDLRELDAEEVREVIEGVGRLQFSWLTGDGRPDRAQVTTTIDGVPYLVILYPAIGELATVWNLGSAYPNV